MCRLLSYRLGPSTQNKFTLLTKKEILSRKGPSIKDVGNLEGLGSKLLPDYLLMDISKKSANIGKGNLEGLGSKLLPDYLLMDISKKSVNIGKGMIKKSKQMTNAFYGWS